MFKISKNSNIFFILEGKFLSLEGFDLVSSDFHYSHANHCRHDSHPQKSEQSLNKVYFCLFPLQS